MASSRIDQLKKAAIEYSQCGYSIIPVGRDKKPKIAWGQFMTRHASISELKNWFSQDVNMAVVTGEISGGLYAIDFDSLEIFIEFLRLPGMEDLANQLVTEKSGGGAHLFFKCDLANYCQKLAYLPSEDSLSGKRAMIELRGNNGYIIIDPSIHANGQKYEVLKGDLKNVPLVSKETVGRMLDAARSLHMSSKIKAPTNESNKPSAINEDEADVVTEIVFEWNLKPLLKSLFQSALIILSIFIILF